MYSIALLELKSSNINIFVSIGHIKMYTNYNLINLNNSVNLKLNLEMDDGNAFKKL